ncbi:MAG: hypothetical protein AAFY52_02160 [Pseudomonadota bacterium]
MMIDRRKTTFPTTDALEDATLFGEPLQNVVVALTPELRRTSRGDVVIVARVGTTREVPVIFAGRRAKLAHKLHRQLNRLALVGGQTGEAAARVELPVLVQGVWHAHTHRNEEGWEHKTYRLMAATWAVYEGDKPGVFEGEWPLNQHDPGALDYG